LSRADYIVPILGTSHRHRLEENAAAASLKISADIQDALLKVFMPGAASGLRYPENHLARLGSDRAHYWFRRESLLQLSRGRADLAERGRQSVIS
jgi:hypothetical protein